MCAHRTPTLRKVGVRWAHMYVVWYLPVRCRWFVTTSSAYFDLMAKNRLYSFDSLKPIQLLISAWQFEQRLWCEQSTDRQINIQIRLHGWQGDLYPLWLHISWYIYLILRLYTQVPTNEPGNIISYKIQCAHREYSDQPGLAYQSLRCPPMNTFSYVWAAHRMPCKYSDHT